MQESLLVAVEGVDDEAEKGFDFANRLKTVLKNLILVMNKKN